MKKLKKKSLNLEKVSNGAGGKVPQNQVSVNKQSVTLPSWINKKFGEKDDGRADVLKDKKNKIIAIEPSDDGQFSTKYHRVNCSKILQSLGVDHKAKKRYEAEWDDGSLLVDLNKPVK